MLSYLTSVWFHMQRWNVVSISYGLLMRNDGVYSAASYDSTGMETVRPLALRKYLGDVSALFITASFLVFASVLCERYTK